MAAFSETHSLQQPGFPFTTLSLGPHGHSSPNKSIIPWVTGCWEPYETKSQEDTAMRHQPFSGEGRGSKAKLQPLLESFHSMDRDEAMTTMGLRYPFGQRYGASSPPPLWGSPPSLSLLYALEDAPSPNGADGVP